MDPELAEHLKRCGGKGLWRGAARLEIEPQIFLLRWIRLLFCREFDLEECIKWLFQSSFGALSQLSGLSREPYWPSTSRSDKPHRV